MNVSASAPLGRDGVYKVDPELEMMLESRNRSGVTVLHQACVLGFDAAVKELRVLGADVNAQDKDGLTPLHWACREGHSATVKALLAPMEGRRLGITLSCPTKNEKKHEKRKNRSQRKKKRIEVTYENRDSDIDGDCHSSGEDSTKPSSGLSLPPSTGSDIVSTHSSVPLSVPDNSSVSLQVSSNSNEVTSFNLAKSAFLSLSATRSVCDVHIKERRGNTALFLTVQMAVADISTVHLNYLAIVEYLLYPSLLETLFVDHGESFPGFPLPNYTEPGLNVRLRGASGANVKDVCGVERDTPLHAACCFIPSTALIALEIVMLLLSAGANPNSVNNNGSTPLHLAASRGSIDIVRILVDAGARATIINYDGDSALHISCRSRYLEISELLLRDAYADRLLKDQHGFSPQQFIDEMMFERDTELIANITSADKMNSNTTPNFLIKKRAPTPQKMNDSNDTHSQVITVCSKCSQVINQRSSAVVSDSSDSDRPRVFRNPNDIVVMLGASDSDSSSCVCSKRGRPLVKI